jgi:hypothetical protein
MTTPAGATKAHVATVAPPRPVIPRDRCNAGVTPCGAPARPYLCGPRCGQHAPNAKESS